MGLTKTELNLRRLLAGAPHQQNQTKLIHLFSVRPTLREQLEQLAEEKTNEGIPRISKALLNEYLDKIEAVAERLAACEINGESSLGVSPDHSLRDSMIESPTKGLRRRLVSPSVTEHVSCDAIESDPMPPVKIDAGAHMNIQKYRKLQEDLTEEIVELVGQLKQGSILTSQSNQNTERLLDSIEKAVEHNLARTGHANTRAAEVYSQSSKTSCFTWIMMFAVTCIFIMVVLLIRVT